MILFIKIILLLIILSGVGFYMLIAAEMIAKEMIQGEEIIVSDPGEEVDPITKKL